MRRKTIEDVRAAFSERGFTLLSTEYVNCRVLLEFICDKGHHDTINWNNFYTGHGCSVCAGTKRHDYDYVKKRFEERGFTLLSSKYKNKKQKLNIICDKGHTTTITFGDFSTGHGCGVCEHLRRTATRENHWSWNPLLTDEERLIGRSTNENYEWRKKVFERDNYRCQCCGDYSRKGHTVVIHAHHLEAWHANPNLRYVVDNGVTLCKSCHFAFHNEYGRFNNTRQQYDEWISAHTMTG